MPIQSTQTAAMEKFRVAVKEHGPYIAFRRGVILALPGVKAREYLPGDTVKLEDDWLDDRDVVLRLFGILADSKEGRNDAVAVLRDKAGAEAAAHDFAAQLQADYAAHEEDLRAAYNGRGSRARVNGDAAKDKLIADLTKRLEALEKKGAK